MQARLSTLLQLLIYELTAAVTVKIISLLFLNSSFELFNGCLLLQLEVRCSADFLGNFLVHQSLSNFF